MSDDFFHRPADLRSLPKHIRDQMSKQAPLRQGEVHSTVTIHNTDFKGTTMPTGRLWVEPYYDAKEGQRPKEGIQFSIYDPAGTRLLVVARVQQKQCLPMFEAAIRSYLRQGGSAEELQGVFNRIISPDPSDT